MRQDSLASRRFTELATASEQIKLEQRGDREYVDISSWHKWATNVLNLLANTFGESSPHFKNFSKAYSNFYYSKDEFDIAKGIFDAAKEDYDGGYLFKFEALVSGEIFGDFISLAKISLSEGNKDVAAVLASAALEDSLKRFAVNNDISVQNKVMQEVVGALKSKGLVGGAQKTLLDTMPKLRDYAMHANWDKLRPEDISSMIGFVEQFLLSNF
jgi:hypothetical protein